MSNDSKCCAATPSGDLLRDLLDSRIAKSEREWFASREIARLKGEEVGLHSRFHLPAHSGPPLAIQYRRER